MEFRPTHRNRQFPVSSLPCLPQRLSSVVGRTGWARWLVLNFRDSILWLQPYSLSFLFFFSVNCKNTTNKHSAQQVSYTPSSFIQSQYPLAEPNLGQFYLTHGLFGDSLIKSWSRRGPDRLFPYWMNVFFFIVSVSASTNHSLKTGPRSCSVLGFSFFAGEGLFLYYSRLDLY